MHPEWNLVITIAAARHHEGQVVEDPFAETMHEGQSMRGREFDTRLPLFGAAISNRLRRNPELHERPPVLPLDEALFFCRPLQPKLEPGPADIAAGLPCPWVSAGASP